MSSVRGGDSAPTLGLPLMGQEPEERRDFLPSLARRVADLGVDIRVEKGLGARMGYSDRHYLNASERVRIVDRAEAFAQDVVLVLRSPDDRFELMRSGATLVSMLHFPTRVRRYRRLKELGIEAVSLDLIVDDNNRRLVENMEAVAWNGLEASFKALAHTYSGFKSHDREPIRVTIMGAGMVGKHAVEAATKYGSLERARTMSGFPGVEVTVLGRNLTSDEHYLRARLAVSDLLVDATYRSDASRPLILNEWVADLPEHAVICDLSVDPYQPDAGPPTVRGIEGIPLGSLEQYVFYPEDPNWSAEIPQGVPTVHRRTTVSCYSWPGIHPRACMHRYEEQLLPLLKRLIESGGAGALRIDGGYLERALYRASMGAWASLV
ncbi:MAG: alanine dehydrogenase [Actinomycetota bacterium]